LAWQSRFLLLRQKRRGGSPLGLERACALTPFGARNSFRLCRSIQATANAENLLIIPYFVP
jgi:hypothetical protein